MIEALKTKHYVTAAGEYIGGFGGVRVTTETQNPREVVTVDPKTGEEFRSVEYDPPTITVSEEWPSVPAGAVEVTAPPASPLHKWDGVAWVAPGASVIAADKAKRAAEILGARPEIAALIEVLAGRFSITPAALLADVVAKLASK